MTELVSQPPEESMIMNSTRPQSGLSDWSDYNLEWLFDPDRCDHLPIEEQLKYFKTRNLKNTKVYKCAAKIWGAPPSRKRVIFAKAPSRLSPISSSIIPAFNSELKPQTLPEKVLPVEVVETCAETDKLAAYRTWINERKSFRDELDKMGPSEDWLRQKPDKTPLEGRVLARMIKARTNRPPTPHPPEEEPTEPVLPEEPPIVRRNCPLAIKVLEKFLLKNKMRLIDLFQSVDKDKSWTVTRKEFRQAIKQTKVPISDTLLEDLILTLDLDFNDQLDYRELAIGMDLWKTEKRESKRQMVLSDDINSSPSKFSKVNGYDPPEIDNELEPASCEKTSALKSEAKSKSIGEVPPEGTTGDGEYSKARVRSAVSTISSASVSSTLLEAPPPDTRQEQRMLSSDEAMLDLRKQNRETLSRYKKGKLTDSGSTIIKTMDPAADHHLLPTTLTGSTAELLHKFRQLKYKEYNDVCNLCQEEDIPLTESLLQKVLLYPADKPHNQLRKQLRQPAMPLLSKGFHRPLPPTKQSHSSNHSEITVHSERTSKLGRTGKSGNYTKRGSDRRQAYLSKTLVQTTPAKQHLSTGKALVSKKIDCWMTFEEYDRLTSHLGEQFSRLYGPSEDNVFWPGHLLDKLRLCMPESTPKTTAIFSVVQTRGRYH